MVIGLSDRKFRVVIMRSLFPENSGYIVKSCLFTFSHKVRVNI